MIVVGAKGMAIEVLEILSIQMCMGDEKIKFFDNLNKHTGQLVDRFEILSNFEEVKDYFLNTDPRFILGLGNPKLRKIMAEKFISLGGEFTTLISAKAQIGSFNTIIGKGCQLMHGVIVTNNITIGEGVLVNLNTTISHDCTIGNYTEIACNVSIPGRCSIGENVFIGSNATFNPDLIIGNNAIIGAGAVVIENVEPFSTVVGNPAKKIVNRG